MPTIEEIAARRVEWVRMARKIGADEDLAQDLVSEMFIKLLEINKSPEGLARIEYKGDINTMFIFVTLRNLYIDHYRREKKTFTETEQTEVYTEPRDARKHRYMEVNLHRQNNNTQYDYADREYETLCDCVDKELRNEHWYNKKLFEIFHNDDKMSYRKMEIETGIPYYSIYESIKNVRNTIKEKCQKQWRKYQEAREKA
jgi:hypothetical protein